MPAAVRMVARLTDRSTNRTMEVRRMGSKASIVESLRRAIMLHAYWSECRILYRGGASKMRDRSIWRLNTNLLN
jgi:hypothetical protein